MKNFHYLFDNRHLNYYNIHNKRRNQAFKREGHLLRKKGVIGMKEIGIVRKVDELGRIVLPIELRRTLDIVERDELEIYVDGNAVVLKKYEPTCVFCDGNQDVVKYCEKNVCRSCMKALSAMD